jgi:tRNA modification GTPase
MRFDTESTICSIASGTEGAYRGAIRITGPDALPIAARASNTENLREWSAKRAVRFQASLNLESLGQIEVAFFVWPDSRSYTGQPSVELHCLGNLIILQSIQARLIRCGAVLAEPGEFTLRAFLAGRLDLTQCEAVLGVIHAANQRSLQVALSQLAGGLTGPLSALRLSLIHLLADIEAGLDFVDENIEFITKAQVQDRLQLAHGMIEDLQKQMEARAAQSVELQAVIVGAPNAGKSSLVNAIAQRQVSIVSAEPGTTRDYVKLRLDWNGVKVELVDTAGTEEFDASTLRGVAQRVTRERIADADLVLFCLSAEHVASPEGLGMEGIPTDCPIWLVHTKCDLGSGKTDSSQAFDQTFHVSIHQRQTVETFVHSLQSWALEHQENTDQVVPLTAARCQVSLANAMQAVLHALHASQASLGDEIIASEVRLALEEIGMVAGTVYTDDILDALFSRFCIGK